RLAKALELPNLIDIQKRSFEWLVATDKGGLRETIDDVSPIEDYTGNLAVVFEDISFDDPTASIDECREKDLTYARPLTVKVAFQNRETGEIREQSVFMGDFPWMTDWGTFIINGTERVVVTQLVRSPGAYLMEPKDREKQVFIANLMPARGSWLELEIDKKGKVFVRIDRKRKLPVTVLLRAMGYASDEEILGLFENSLYIRNTIESDTEATLTEEGALIELIQEAFRIGLYRMERVVRERLTTEDADTITPQTIINIRPVVAALKEFFGSSQLSQFMDQTNSLAGLTHRRRLSALGAGGLTRERAPIEVRDVHPTHYGRMCPIETPEGPNIGLMGSLASFATVSEFGFIQTPYRKVSGGKVSDDIVYLDAAEEARYTIAQASAIVDEKTGRLKEDQVLCRSAEGEAVMAAPKDVEFMDVAPAQIVSVATALIPFLEHNDANRALMGANMQRQAVPLMITQAPLVGTGLEYRAAVDTGDVVLAKTAGTILDVDADRIVVETKDGKDEYSMTKFMRSNQGTLIHHKPIVRLGDKIKADQVLADGSSTDRGELALGANLLVAFMPFEGYNFEDAIVLSERLVKDDVLSSIHIHEYEI